MRFTTIERRFLIVIAALASAVVLLVSLSRPRREVSTKQFTPLARPTAQQVTARTYKTNLEKLAVIARVSGEPLYRPFSLKMDDEGNLYVIDFGDIQVKKFSQQGELLVRFGTAQGSAPGEFRNPIDYDFDPDGNIWVCDSETSLITVFNGSGAVVRTVRVSVSPLRIKVMTNDRFLLMLNGAKQLFGVFDSMGKELYSFGAFIEDQIKNDIVLDGWLARIGREGFVYASLYAGMFAGFSFQGELLCYAQAITPQPLPKAVSTADGGMYVDPEAVIVHRDVCTIADTAFMLSRFGVPNDHVSVIDAYDARKGTYLFSMSVPQKVRSAVVTPERVYTLADTSVTIWKR